jgi:hypothetical protein
MENYHNIGLTPFRGQPYIILVEGGVEGGRMRGFHGVENTVFQSSAWGHPTNSDFLVSEEMVLHDVAVEFRRSDMARADVFVSL